MNISSRFENYMQKIEKLSQYLRSAVTLCLVFMLLGLGSCQAKRSFEALLGFATDTEHRDNDSGQVNLTVISCSGNENEIKRHLQVPGHALSINHAVGQLAADLFLFKNPAIESGKGISFNRQLILSYPSTIPVYLRNRSILI